MLTTIGMDRESCPGPSKAPQRLFAKVAPFVGGPCSPRLETELGRVFFVTNREWVEDTGTFGYKVSATTTRGYVIVHSSGRCRVERLGRAAFKKRVAEFERQFVYIHGFNTTFHGGAYSLCVFAQKLMDAQLTSTAFVMLSWPSEGQVFVSLSDMMKEGSPYERLVWHSLFFVSSFALEVSRLFSFFFFPRAAACSVLESSNRLDD